MQTPPIAPSIVQLEVVVDPSYYISHIIALQSTNFVATAWSVKSNKHLHGTGARFFYINKRSNSRCDGIQEIASQGQPGSEQGAPQWHRAYCFSTEEYKINKDAAFAVTSLAGVGDYIDPDREQDLLNLHLFYWSKNAKNEDVIKDTAWNPRTKFFPKWTPPLIASDHAVPGADTSKLAAISWMNPKTRRIHWSVFYIQSGYLKEMTYGDYINYNWKSEDGFLEERLDIRQVGNLNDISEIQATVWVDRRNTIHKRVYLLNRAKRQVYEFGSSMEDSEKPIGVSWRGKIESVDGATAMTINADGTASGLRLYTIGSSGRVTEYRSSLRGYGNEVYLKDVTLTPNDLGGDGKVDGHIALAFQSTGQKKRDKRTRQFVFYTNSRGELQQIHRDASGVWFHSPLVHSSSIT